MAKVKLKPKLRAFEEVTRAIGSERRFLLFVRAGGRCEFDGCNEYLLQHHVRLTTGNFGEMAHIVAFSPRGPRGSAKRPKAINNAENLMLLCQRCHKLIDSEPDNFSVETLLSYKKNHEERIFYLTGLGADQKTSLLILNSKIGEHTVAIPYDQMLAAVIPRYPLSKEGLLIDLRSLTIDTPESTAAACQAIEEHLRHFFGPAGEIQKTKHISLFAFGTIPLLAFLGSRLSNKVPIDVYQRHRAPENWKWRTGTGPVNYSLRRVVPGSSTEAGLVLSLSGAIPTESVMPLLQENTPIWEITLRDEAPNPAFLRTRRDLEGFILAYHQALGEILKKSPGTRVIHLFPAVPIPVAVHCGRELLPKAHPAMRIYDNNKAKGGFVYQLTINDL